MNMTTGQVNEMIASIGLPYAYFDFLDGVPSPPYLCFFYPEGRDLYADGTNYSYVDELRLRVYRAEPDLHDDRRICRVLNTHGLSCTWERGYDREAHEWITEFAAEVGINEPEGEET